MKECFVVLGNQLFDKKYLTEFKNSCDFFIQEDMGLCSYFKHHKQKIYYFLASMREYRDCLLYTSPSPRDGTKSRMPSSA